MKIVHPAAKQGKKIVFILGAGFAGLNAAKTLADHEELQVVLVDRRNYHLFQPLLYQVATAGLNPSDIAVPIRAQFSEDSNVEVHMGSVEVVNLKEKFVSSGDLQFAYDYLILACGAQHSYFAHPEWEEFAPGLKNLEQGTEIRRRILTAFERAENELDPEKQKAFLNFVIVGGGPTGVELAGAIADISRTVLVRDFRHINPSKARIFLIEAGNRVLASFDEALSRKAAEDLQHLGVEVQISQRVQEINAEGVRVGAQWIPSKSVFWAAGVQATRLKMEPAVEMDRNGRVLVQKDFSIPEFSECFVVGDMASMEVSPKKYLPGLAPVAIQGGRFVAKMILHSIHGRAREEFHYLDKGQMATIGKHKAIAEAGKLRLSGYLAWLAWLFVHIAYLIGFKNRIAVLAQWAWSYAFSKRGARLITERDWKLKS